MASKSAKPDPEHRFICSEDPKITQLATGKGASDCLQTSRAVSVEEDYSGAKSAYYFVSTRHRSPHGGLESPTKHNKASAKATANNMATSKTPRAPKKGV